MTAAPGQLDALLGRASWAGRPVARYKPKPPRLICFFGRAEGGRQVSYQLQLSARRNGKKARIDGPDISANLASRELTHYLADVITKWSGTHRTLIPAAPAPN
jgi:hypothetical protein